MSDIIISFDYESLSKKYHIESNILQQLAKDAYAEFPYDEMMAELHIVRALRALHLRNDH